MIDGAPHHHCTSSPSFPPPPPFWLFFPHFDRASFFSHCSAFGLWSFHTHTRADSFIMLSPISGRHLHKRSSLSLTVSSRLLVCMYVMMCCASAARLFAGDCNYTKQTARQREREMRSHTFTVHARVLASFNESACLRPLARLLSLSLSLSLSPWQSIQW